MSAPAHLIVAGANLLVVVSFFVSGLVLVVVLLLELLGWGEEDKR